MSAILLANMMYRLTSEDSCRDQARIGDSPGV